MTLDLGMPAASEPPLDFGGAVLLVVDSIPPGRVMTYGGVAAELGSLGARAVGRVMATEGSSVPWWRVVRADGRPPAGHEAEALARYRAEGTPLRWVGNGVVVAVDDRYDPHAYRLDLEAARWSPSQPPGARGDTVPESGERRASRPRRFS